MKKTADGILRLIGRLLSYLWPSSASKALAHIRDKIYTGYLTRSFASFGRTSTIRWKPIRLEGLQFISIGEDTLLEPALQLTAWQHGAEQPRITIGNHCTLRRGCHVTASRKIIIGDNLLTGTNVLITDNSHGEATREQMQLPPDSRPIYSKGPVVIGDNVWLGNNVCVMPGVTIGDGAVIGANSVVTHDVPAYSVAAGIPAKIINVRACAYAGD